MKVVNEFNFTLNSFSKFEVELKLLGVVELS